MPDNPSDIKMVIALVFEMTFLILMKFCFVSIKNSYIPSYILICFASRDFQEKSSSMTSNISKPSDQTITRVPLLDLKRQYLTIKSEIAAGLNDVNESGMFILGPEVRKLEERIAEYSKTGYGIGCASGSDALLLALRALGIKSGDEVIVPSFTFFATVSCVTRLGATPVFADIDPVSFNLDPIEVEKKITDRTKAIIPVHLFGQMADMDAIQAMTVKHSSPARQRIAIVEDSAQAIGAELHGIRTGQWGTMACLSFYPTKNLGGAGDGGMVLTNDPEIAHQVQLLRGHGMEPRYYHKVVGVNSRLDSYQAAVLNVKLPHLDTWTQMRQKNAALYKTLFQNAGLDSMVTIPAECPDRRHVWNQYVIRIHHGKRNELRGYLTEHNVGTDIYYPLGLHQQECFQYLGYKPEDLPETLKASQEVLALPIFPELRPEEQDFVVESIKNFLSKI